MVKGKGSISRAPGGSWRYVAAQLACVIDSNYPALDNERIENMAIEFAYQVHLAQQEH